MGRNSQAHTLVQNLTFVTFKMWACSPTIAEISNFWYKFAQKGYTPLSDFGLGEGVPDPHRHTKFHRCGFKNLSLRPPKIWYKFGPMGKFWGSTEKVEYRCTTTNLSLCNDTIIVLKITPLHNVSVITISSFQSVTNKKNITLFHLQPARDPRSPPYLAW